jgi:hypothetical protein
MQPTIRVAFLLAFFLLGVDYDCQGRRLDLTCIQTTWGLYGQVSDDNRVIHQWWGPCQEATEAARFSVDHVVDPHLDTIRVLLRLSGVGLVASATAQARFQTRLGQTYRIDGASYVAVGSAIDHEQGVFVRVYCPSRDASEALSWWFDERGWYSGEPTFTATATETCRLEMREVCFHVGGEAESGACGATVSVRWSPPAEPEG